MSIDDKVKVLQNEDGTKEIRHDGYVNLLNKYGTPQDNSEAYKWNGAAIVSDMELAHLYETGGLFAKIIDAPAEEAFKTGFSLNLNDTDTEQYIINKLEELNWEENGTDAVRWARLFGGALIVMLVDDGKGLDEPLEIEKVKSIQELRVYDRSIAVPDYTSLYQFDLQNPWKSITPKFGMPEYYYVFSTFGQFIVHESRCLIFKNGPLPEQTTQAVYRFWGIPEYLRIKDSLKDTVVAHSNAAKLLDRCVQAIYGMKNLSMELMSEGGDERVLQRLQLIDMARGILNSMVIDADGETYTFEDMTLTGVQDLVFTICQMLSAVTNIPQALLFGREPAGMNATGKSDFESFYNWVDGKFRKRMIRKNLKYLIDIITKVGISEKKIKDKPDYKLEFKPLWSMTEAEKSDIELKKAQTEYHKAKAIEIHVDKQIVDPLEVRAALKKDEEFVIAKILDEESPDESVLWTEREEMIEKMGEETGEEGEKKPTKVESTQGGTKNKGKATKRVIGETKGDSRFDEKETVDEIRGRWKGREWLKRDE